MLEFAIEYTDKYPGAGTFKELNKMSSVLLKYLTLKEIDIGGSAGTPALNS